MIIVDLNVLIYAVNASSAQHRVVSTWWNNAMNGDEPVGLPWIVLNGFLRLTTRSGILPSPLPLDTAFRIVDSWLACDHVLQPREADDHWTVFQRLLVGAGTGGNLVTDAYLAALAIGNGATLVTCDRDFARFVGLSWMAPGTT